MDKLTQLARWIKSGGYLEICAAFQSRPALYACGGRYITTPKTHPIKSSSAPVTTSTGLHLFINRTILCRTSTAAVVVPAALCESRPSRTLRWHSSIRIGAGWTRLIPLRR
jgi:hypothetical protein